MDARIATILHAVGVEGARVATSMAKATMRRICIENMGQIVRAGVIVNLGGARNKGPAKRNCATVVGKRNVGPELLSPWALR